MMENTNLKKYLSNDIVFCMINKMFITLDPAEVKRSNMYLEIVRALVQLMRNEDPLFAKSYQEIIYCGSFYKGTKVGKPNEYDLNIVLKFPIDYQGISLSSNQPGFTKIHVTNASLTKFLLKYDSSNPIRKSFQKLISQECLDPDNVRQWIEGILSKVFQTLPKNGNKYTLQMQNRDGTTRKFKIKKSGPAFTLILSISEESEDIHIDLAPALVFQKYNIHGSSVRMNEIQTYKNKVWYAIPLPTNNNDWNEKLHWRFNFCHQENELLTRYSRIKPVIRQMKKLRDTQNWKSIASYFIETLFLHKLMMFEEDFDRIPFTLLFFKMLKELYNACNQCRIEYFWDLKYNLLQKIKASEMCNITCRLNRIIMLIEKQISPNPYIIAEHILNTDELRLLQLEYDRRQNNNQDVGSLCTIM
ncbi:cyclic GMP-AMP synthase-like receptor [Hylaeus anthracinus]|uniref:cyclic GMP-AMP synthase-like receptor n=1 Tax=Hylaeus anthracinus TaxID=313031 RepID=UPI0023B8ECC0|nr:cyclic GMP-AMP synthase-like receptor [Hylaeus anthracinus]